MTADDVTVVMQKLNDIGEQIATVSAEQAKINQRIDDLESKQVTSTQVASQVEAAKSESAAYVDTKLDAFSKRIDQKFDGFQTAVMQSVNDAVKSLGDTVEKAIERFEDIASAVRDRVESSAEIVRMNRHDISEVRQKYDVLDTAVQSNDERAGIMYRDLYGDAARDGLISDWRKSQETIAELLRLQQADAARKEQMHGYITAFMDVIPTGRRGAVGLGAVVAFIYYVFTFLPSIVGG